jgi:hypothetical protein
MRVPTHSLRSNHYKTTTGFRAPLCIKGLAPPKGWGIRCVSRSADRSVSK